MVRRSRCPVCSEKVFLGIVISRLSYYVVRHRRWELQTGITGRMQPSQTSTTSNETYAAMGMSHRTATTEDRAGRRARAVC